MCTKGFLNYLKAIVVFLKVVFKDEIVKFLKHCDTFAIKESGGVNFSSKIFGLSLGIFKNFRHCFQTV